MIQTEEARNNGNAITNRYRASSRYELTGLTKQYPRHCPLTTFPLAAHVAKPKFRLENTLSWSVISMTHLHTPVTPSSTVLFTSLQTILECLALTTDRDLLWHNS